VVWGRVRTSLLKWPGRFPVRATGLRSQLLFTVLRSPHTVRGEGHHKSIMRCDALAGGVVDEQGQRQERVCHGLVDLRDVSPIALSNPTVPDLHDGKLPFGHSVFGLAIPQVVESETDVLAGVLPASCAEVVAHQQV